MTEAPVSITPLGSPVVPEVYGMNARWSPVTSGPGAAAASPVQDRSSSMASTWAPTSPSAGSLDWCWALVTTTLGRDSATMARSRRSGESRAMGMNAPPAFRAPRLATMNSAQVSMKTPTGSSVETP